MPANAALSRAIEGREGGTSCSLTFCGLHDAIVGMQETCSSAPALGMRPWTSPSCAGHRSRSTPHPSAGKFSCRALGSLRLSFGGAKELSLLVLKAAVGPVFQRDPDPPPQMRAKMLLVAGFVQPSLPCCSVCRDPAPHHGLDSKPQGQPLANISLASPHHVTVDKSL